MSDLAGALGAPPSLRARHLGTVVDPGADLLRRARPGVDLRPVRAGPRDLAASGHARPGRHADRRHSHHAVRSCRRPRQGSVVHADTARTDLTRCRIAQRREHAAPDHEHLRRRERQPLVQFRHAVLLRPFADDERRHLRRGRHRALLDRQPRSDDDGGRALWPRVRHALLLVHHQRRRSVDKDRRLVQPGPVESPAALVLGGHAPGRLAHARHLGPRLRHAELHGCERAPPSGRRHAEP